MIAAWILYCALWSLWLSAAAWATERILLNARGPVRMLWLAAMVLSVVGPIVSYWLPRSTTVAPTLAPVPVDVSTNVGPLFTRSATVTPLLERPLTLRDVAARADRPLALAWIAISLGVVLYVAGGVVRLRLLRRRWQPRVVAGTPVMISDNTGPALVGVFESTIVIPAWALELQPDALALMLRHELEHRAAGDTRTLALAQAALVVMPWNPLTWWQLRRLRLAIELDCDARVLRATNDVGSYGRLLLEFGQQRRSTRLAGAALADHHASQLETRIRRLTRGAPLRRGNAIALSAVAAGFGIAIGCQIPTPPAPQPGASPTDRSARSVSGDSSSARVDSAIRQAVRNTPTSREIEIERERRIAALQRELERELARRDSTREFQSMRNWRDSLPLALFKAQVALAEARDSASRALWQRQVDDERRLFDSVTASNIRRHGELAGTDSLRRVIAQLEAMLATKRAFFTEEHPDVKALLAEMAKYRRDYPDLQRALAELARKSALPDSLAALEQGASCNVNTTLDRASVIKFLVSDSDLARIDRIVVNSLVADEQGAKLEYDNAHMTCAAQGDGEVRLFGRGAFLRGSLVVRSTLETSLIVVTGSGRVLAGPIAIRNEARRYELPLRR